MDKKAWIIFGIIVVAVVGGMVYLSTQNRLDLGDITKERAGTIIGGEVRNGQIGDHVTGNKDANIVLVEYGDYQCPPCKAAYPIVKNLTTAYGDHVAFVFRNFPVSTSHPNARIAAGTAEAAGLQGKYQEMHDMLFEQQSAWSGASLKERDSVFLGYAEQLGLDVNRFKTDIASDAVNKKITFDAALGRQVGVTGTPAFFLNGESVNANELEAKIKEKLNKLDVKTD